MTKHDKYLKDKQHIMVQRVKTAAYGASMILKLGAIDHSYDRRNNSKKRLQLI